MCDSPRNSEHALFYDPLQPLGYGGAVKIFYDFINELIKYKGVCRAAPGFAQVGLLALAFILCMGLAEAWPCIHWAWMRGDPISPSFLCHPGGRRPFSLQQTQIDVAEPQ